MEIRSARVYLLPMSPDELWDRLTAVRSYQTWWPWLRQFDGTELMPGQLWRCTLRPPLPYAIRGQVRLRSVVERSFIAADVSGDLAGPARIELRSAGPVGTEVELRSCLVARSRPLRAMARAAPGLARRAHDRLLDAAAHQFTSCPPEP